MSEGREVRIGMVEQLAWDTPIADNGTFTEINTEPMAIERDIRTHETNSKSLSRQLIYANRVVRTDGSMATFTTSGPFTIHENDNNLHAFFQNVVEDASTPFTKNFSYFATQPDLTAVANPASTGHLMTFIKRFPTSSTSWKMQDCIATGFKLSGERDGMLMMETNWVSRGAPVETSNPSGTWEIGLDAPGGADAQSTQYGLLFFNDIDIAQVKIDGGGATTVTIQSFNLEMQHVIEGVGPDGSGGFTEYGIHTLEGKMEIEFLKDAQFESALSGQKSDGHLQININWGAATAVIDGELEIIVTGKITEEVTINEDGLLGVTIPIQILAATSITDGLLINISNAIDRVWS